MDEPFDLTEIFSFLWKKKAIIIIVTLIFMIVPFIKLGIIDKPADILSEAVEDKDNDNDEQASYYYAQTTFTSNTSNAILANKDIDNLNSDLSELRVSTYGEMIKSQVSLNNIISKLNLNTNYHDLYNLISVSRVSNSNLVRIVVAYTEENQALNIANELLNEFTNNISNVYATEQVSIIDKAYILSDKAIADIFKTYIMQSAGNDIALNNTLFSVDIAHILPSEYLSKIFNEYIITDNEIIASTSFDTIKSLVSEPVSNTGVVTNNSNILRKVCIAGAIGFVLSAGFLVVIDFLSDTINNENYIDTKILATIKDTNNNDIFDVLKIKLEQNKTIILANTENTDKSTSISNNLAKAFAKNNKVLLLDLANNSSSIINNYNGNGIFDCINDLENINKNIVKSNINNLDVLLQGTESIPCINEQDLAKTISSLENNYDHIIINSKNILEDANSLLITKLVKNTVLTITERKTKIDAYIKIKESIADVNANLIGSIFIK